MIAVGNVGQRSCFASPAEEDGYCRAVSAIAPGSEEPGGRAAVVIADQLRRRIIRGELAEGDVLPTEQELLTEFGVSRPTLREAIRILESESLVVVKRGSRGGIEVSVPRIETAAHYAGLLLEYSQATLGDVFRAACAIEAPCAAMLARSRTAADLQRLRDVVAAERSARGDAEELLSLQNQFHRLLIDLVGNTTLRVLSDVLRHIIEVATQKYLTSPASARGGANSRVGGRYSGAREAGRIDREEGCREGRSAVAAANPRHWRAIAAQRRRGVRDRPTGVAAVTRRAAPAPSPSPDRRRRTWFPPRSARHAIAMS